MKMTDATAQADKADDQNDIIEDQVPNEDFLGEDDDPMLVAMKEAEKEIGAEGGKSDQSGEPEKKEAKGEDQGKKPAETPMIPKGRFDEILAERDKLREAANYLQGIVDTQGQMLKGAKPAETDRQGEQKHQEQAPPDLKAQITTARSDLLKLAEKYDEGEISMAEYKKQEFDLQEKIDALREADITAKLEDTNRKTSETVAASQRQTRIEEVAISIQEKHPFVDKLDALPKHKSEAAWHIIDTEARQQLAQQGINPDDGKIESRIAYMQAKAALTDTYGPMFTGEQISQPEKKPSETAHQRAAKLDLQTQHPPEIGASKGAGEREPTESDILKLSDDQLADLLKTAPQLVHKAVGFKN